MASWSLSKPTRCPPANRQGLVGTPADWGLGKRSEGNLRCSASFPLIFKSGVKSTKERKMISKIPSSLAAPRYS